MVFDRDVPPDFPTVPGDPEQIQRLLLNLLMNSVQAGTAGGRIGISARVEGENAVLRVKDDGAGIPVSIRNHIFEPFFTTRDTGLGLGLPVALHIATGHGGRIALEESPDCKTCFVVSLPLAGPC